MIGVALLGYGLAGQVFHAPLVRAEPRLVLSHIVTRDPERAALAARTGAQVVPTADALWDKASEFDVVVVATSNTSHVPLATAALGLGKLTVVDKPLALTSAAAAALVARDPGGLLTVFQNRRWDSDTLTARALLASGRLGEVLRLESRFTRFRPVPVDRWREHADEGGGVLLDLGAHLVDQALHLLGPAVSVFAEVATRRVGGQADDDCFLALRHSGGATSHLWVSMAAPVPGPRLLLQGTSAGWSKADLDGQEDALRAGVTPPPEPEGTLWDEAGGRPWPSAQGNWGAFYRQVADRVETGAPVPVEPADVVTVMAVLDAARTSAAARTIIEL